jgi:predicted dehydrogenase
MLHGTSRRTFTTSAAFLSLGGFAGGRVLVANASAGSAPSSATTAGIAQAQASQPGGAGPLAPPDRQPPDLEVPAPVTRKAGWAIVGLGQLALKEVMPAFGECRLSQPVALVSGHPDKARKVAEAYGLDPAAIYGYDNFDRITENDRIDAVYIILPNSMHAEYTIRALGARKHVLCEKPMAVTVAECERMIATAREAGRKLMIGYRLHYEPFNRKVMELCEQKALGRIKTFSSSNCQDVKAPNIRLSGELGGGPVGDTGVYSINAARYVTGEEPVEVAAMAHRPADDPRFREVPESVSFTLRFPSGVLAHCDCSFATSVSRHYRVHCTDGFINMDPAFGYGGLRLTVSQGSEKKGDARKSELLFEQVNHFAAEMDHFSDCILNGKNPRTPGEMGLADMRVIVTIDEAARTGRWVKVGG